MFAKLSLKVKLVGVFILIAAVGIVIGLTGLHVHRTLADGMTEVADVRMPAVSALLQIQEAQTAVLAGERALLSRRMFLDDDVRRANEKFMDNALSRAEQAWKNYDILPQTSEESELKSLLSSQWNFWRTEDKAFRDLVTQKKNMISVGVALDDSKLEQLDDRIFTKSGEVRSAFLVSRATLEKLVKSNEDNATQGALAAHEVADSGKSQLIMFMLFGFFGAAVFGYVFSRSISTPILRLNDAAQEVAGGNLNVDVELRRQDELGRLAESFGTMIGNLKHSDQMVKSAMAEAGQKVENLNSIPTPIMTIDKEFNVTYMNHAGAGLVGLTSETVKGKKCYDLFKTPHCRTAECRCQQAMQDKNVHSGETVADPSGLNMPIQYTGAPVTDEQGKVIGALEYVVDITNTKKAMDDANLKVGFLDAIPTPVMVIDNNFTVQYMNPAGAAVGGKKPEEVKGTKCYDFFKTTHCKTSECRCKQAMERKENSNGETVANVSGQKIPIDYTGSPLYDEKGNVIGALEYVLDITERKEVLNDIIHVAEAMARNDLTAKATGNYQGDYLKIADSLNQGMAAQHEAMAQVAEAVEQITAAGQQIASSSQSVAEGASEQASSLEETSSSLEEMASMTKQNSDNARQADGMASEAKKASDEGGESMKRMASAMGKIKNSAQGTAAIIKDINEIAFQTNLLALNAAVEAARAGEAGRGFAVVAEEVRNLALRAKEAAQKTENLINESVGLAEEGEQVSDQVNTKLSDILEGIQKVGGIISEIATASEEQSRGIDQVNRAVAEMDKVTQQNAANSEESSSAAEELASQAQELTAMIRRFTLNRAMDHQVEHVKAVEVKAKPKKYIASPFRKNATGASGIALKPEDIIPLDNDPDFSSF